MLADKMNLIKRLLSVGVVLLFASICVAQTDCAENASAEEFSRQLLGDWVKCAPDFWPRPVTNRVLLIERISFRENGETEWKTAATNTTGRYSVEFARPPSTGAVTLVRITLTTQDGQSNTFTRVNFGEDNRFPRSQ